MKNEKNTPKISTTTGNEETRENPEKNINGTERSKAHVTVGNERGEGGMSHTIIQFT